MAIDNLKISNLVCCISCKYHIETLHKLAAMDINMKFLSPFSYFFLYCCLNFIVHSVL